VRVTRLQALQTQIRNSLENLYVKQQDGATKLLGGIYKDTYYRNIYEVHKGLGIGINFAKLDTNTINKVITEPWHGDNYSSRIWKNKEKLIMELQTNLTQAFIRGDSIDKTSKIVTERMEVAKNRARTLVNTESANIVSKATFNSYDSSGVVKEYEILATLDLHTSKICRSMDGKIFKVSEKEIGVNAPPFHPNCRTTTVAYFPDSLDVERIARDHEGNTYYVDGSMNYEQWYKENVANNPKALAEEKKVQNKSSDKQQFEKYKEILGKEIPKSFADFQELKYNNINEWDKLELTYKDQNVRNHIKSDELSKEILIGKQGKHILGHNNYIEGRSYMGITTEELQQIVNEYAGTGNILRDNKGDWSNKELIEVDKTLGVTFDIEGNAMETNKAIIHYSKKGTHVVPTLREVRK
ncbi:polymorphic toxin type 50 domain-containing protein, partial [Clostridium sp.]|uniref:polymorphic toxin type 50 domain-containing protein n=1 Tax=Clostridium sp. TaxID=1506 RepID=UPI003464CB21